MARHRFADVMARLVRGAARSLRTGQPGYQMNKKHWNTVEIDSGVPELELRKMIDHSYELVGQSLSPGARAKITGAPELRRCAIAKRRARC